jgi:hypothetical protein
MLQWKDNKYYTLCVCVRVCVWSLSYPACYAHVPYCHLWPAPLYIIFPHYIIKDTIFEKKNPLLNTECVLISSKTCVWNFSHSQKNWARYDQKFAFVFTESTRYSRPILIKIEFSRQVFEKSPNIKFHENPSSWSRVVPRGQTDGRTDLTKLIVVFRNFASAPKNAQNICLY